MTTRVLSNYELIKKLQKVYMYITLTYKAMVLSSNIINSAIKSRIHNHRKSYSIYAIIYTHTRTSLS